MAHWDMAERSNAQRSWPDKSPTLAEWLGRLFHAPPHEPRRAYTLVKGGSYDIRGQGQEWPC
ncbi:hypothetical protein VI817_001526 [Penicillium citrinum]|nr:hypothetical protein VI817_001526 [Penicillium citrinum]